ncbi:formimidoylglutamate deiminase [Kordiimonas marina]|uniref:formimidoylglutamate deiminase n=1 Tax=Kordiimonas marina TaxID=2872312 RepID=UPI001FF2670A|nr:formimidoylglutamate deiminase [Kordiimonas marina]MCJ9427809.1 formimidoylglutamate deiminase [Kordiimonas marina]
MQTHYFTEGLIGRDWAHDIRVTVAPDGMITEMETGVQAPEGHHARGPVLPAMANLHSHAFQRGFAGLAEVKAVGASDFWSWRRAMYHFAAAMTPEAAEAIAAQLYLEMLKAGYTAVGEFHYLHNSHRDQALDMSGAIMKAADGVGIALTHLPVLYQASDFGGKAPEDAQQPFLHDTEDFIRLLKVLAARLDGGNHRLGMAFHSLRAVPEGSFAPAIEALEDISLKAPIHIHVAEQTREVEACEAFSGKRPVEWLLDTQNLDERWCLIHATHVVEAEWRGMAERGVVAGLCPTTEANLGDGLFPAAEYAAHGGRFGIGSDSHVSIDAREELRLLEYGQRLARQARTVLTPADGGHTGLNLWCAAAEGGAQALAQPIGEIAVGKRADLIVLDDTSATFAATHGAHTVDAFVFAGQPSPVRDVMVAGNWVIEDGAHKNEAEITGRYRDTVARIAADLEVLS